MESEVSTANLDPGKPYTAKVELKDGRLLKAPVMVDPPRPQATLLNKGVQQDTTQMPSAVQLGSPDDLPLDGRLVFFLKSTVPGKFARDEKVELAAADGSFNTELSLADGGLMLEDASTAMAHLEPLKRFGASAFGPVRVRVIAGNGATGDWMPLGTLVRLPGFTELRCPRAASKPCMLAGSNMFLAASISTTPDFNDPVEVPPDFTGMQLAIPHPTNGVIYLKLRDDPATVQTLTMQVTPAVASDLEFPVLSKAKPSPPAEEQSPPPAPAAAPATQPSVADQAQPNSSGGGQK
jgi:cell division septation protein DedD